ncbi:MAG: hypothetical protein LBD23_01760 [Oscillospiraceae bacterium]|jgi:hypothetical protein|nr:hypothetical protein [Oscillospiraceae bacterium]
MKNHTIVFKERKSPTIILLSLVCPFIIFVGVLFNNVFTFLLCLIASVSLTIHVAMTFKTQTILTHESVEHFSGYKILLKDVEKIGYMKSILGKTMVIHYPYESTKNEYKDIMVGLIYFNYMELWQEIVLRSIKANPDVEIAEEFRAMFL